MAAASIGVSSPRRRSVATLAYAALALVALCFAVPFLWLLFASVSREATLSTRLPTSATLDNFQAVLSNHDNLRALWNGVVISGGAAILTVVAAALAAYPLSRYQLRFRRPFLYTILFASGLPVTAIMVPVYGLFVRMHLVNSIPGTVLFMATTSLPFAIWIMKTFLDGVPIELEEAAWVDGASSMTGMRHVVLPLMAPGLGVVVLLTFVATWGNFFVPFILLQDPSKQPASVGIFQFFSSYGRVAYGQLAAYSIVYTAPVAALYLAVARYLGGAFNFSGAVKG